MGKKKLNSTNPLNRLGYIGNGTGVYARSKDHTETQLVGKCVLAIKRELYPTDKYFIMKVHGGAYQRAGIPDIHLITRGMTLYIEIKLPGGDTTALQREKMLELQAAGAYVATCESVEQAVATLQGALLLWGGAKGGFRQQ